MRVFCLPHLAKDRARNIRSAGGVKDAEGTGEAGDADGVVLTPPSTG